MPKGELVRGVVSSGNCPRVPRRSAFVASVVASDVIERNLLLRIVLGII